MKPLDIRLSEISAIQPRVHFANRLDAVPGQTWGPRTIPDCQLLYVLSGRAVLELGPETFALEGGDCIFYGVDSPHRITADRKDPCCFSSIHFSWHLDCAEPIRPFSGIRSCPLDILGRKPVTYWIRDPERGEIACPHLFRLPVLEPLFLQITREFQMDENGTEAYMSGLLMQVLVLIVRHKVNEQYASPAYRKISPALEAVRRSPQHAWDSSQLARLCGYHPTYFAALFHEATGHSPKHFVMRERVNQAKRLLIETGTVEEVAERVGFSSHHYFCRSFKALTGMTPSAYKQRRFEL